MGTTKDTEQPRGTFVCSTNAVAPPLRADHFRAGVSGPYPGLSVDWPAGDTLRAWLRSRPFATARITEFSNTAARIANRPGLHPVDRCHLVLHLTGCARYRQYGREVVQRPGDMVLLDTDVGFDADFPSGLEVLVWELPKELLKPLVVDLERVMAQRIAGDRGLGALLASYALTLGRESPRLNAPEQQPLLIHLCNLIALALGATAPDRETRRLSYRAAQRQRVLVYVETHFRDSRLSSRRAAFELGLSRRWLYQLLDGDAGFAAIVSRRRIEECTRLLNDPAQDHLSIAEIAFHCGFAELSTFNRRFRAKYGMCPRELRRLRQKIDSGLRADHPP